MESMPESATVRLAVARLQNKESSPVVELLRLARAGYFFIGTAESKQQHTPKVDTTYFDRSINQWVYTRRGTPSLIVTNVGGVAILSALFGGINYPNKTHIHGEPLTDQFPPHYAWQEQPGYYKDTQRIQYHYQLRPELISAAQKYGGELTGCIDIVADQPPATTFRDLGQGIFSSHDTLATIASLPVDGTALYGLDYDAHNFAEAPPGL